MPYSVRKLPDMPVILFESPPGESISGNFEAIAAEISRLLETQPEPVFLVIDIRNVTLALDDMLRGIDLATRGHRPVLLHPRIRENVFAAAAPMSIMALKALSSATFGQVKMAQFETVEQALDYCRARSTSFEL